MIHGAPTKFLRASQVCKNSVAIVQSLFVASVKCMFQTQQTKATEATDTYIHKNNAKILQWNWNHSKEGNLQQIADMHKQIAV